MLIAFIAFLAGIAFVLYPVYYCHRYIVDRNDADWAKTLQDRFDQIPKSYHEAFDKGWEACANSESTVRIQHERFFGRVS